MFAAYDEHRTGRMTRDGFARASKKHASQLTSAMCTDHNEIRFGFFRKLGDLVSGLP